MKFKIFILTLIAAFGFNTLSAQMGEKEKRASPPAKMERKMANADIVINYSQPSVKGRVIYGELVPYGKVWRTGANEATTFTTTKDIMVNGKKLPAGTYSLFTIPGEDEWTVIFNSDAEQWGAYKYDEKKDVLRVTAKPMNHKLTEKLTFYPTDEDIIYIDWAETRVPLKIQKA